MQSLCSLYLCSKINWCRKQNQNIILSAWWRRLCLLCVETVKKTQNCTHQTCRHAYALPDLREADDHNPGEVAPLRLADESPEVPIYSVNTSEIQGSRPQAPLPVVRRAAQQLEDVSAISL